MEITATMVKDLRQKSSAPIMDCKKALKETQGDVDKAIDYLRQKGLKASAKREGMDANDGLIVAYIHPGSKIGVMVELSCETDFVARTDDFKKLAQEIAMHIAAADPICVRGEELSSEVVDREKEIYKAQAQDSGKPEKIIEKIVEGKIKQYFSDVCLLEQHYVRDPGITIKDLIESAKSNLKENITVRRFARYQLGELTRN